MKNYCKDKKSTTLCVHCRKIVCGSCGFSTQWFTDFDQKTFEWSAICDAPNHLFCADLIRAKFSQADLEASQSTDCLNSSLEFHCASFGCTQFSRVAQNSQLLDYVRYSQHFHQLFFWCTFVRGRCCDYETSLDAFQSVQVSLLSLQVGETRPPRHTLSLAGIR